MGEGVRRPREGERRPRKAREGYSEGYRSLWKAIEGVPNLTPDSSEKSPTPACVMSSDACARAKIGWRLTMNCGEKVLEGKRRLEKGREEKGRSGGG